MWYEFPTDESTFDNSDQFMWGDNILIAPKIEDPNVQSAASLLTGVYQMSIYLPTACDWFFYPTGKLMSEVGQQDFFVSDSSLAVFVKAGTILPKLNFKNTRMSLLQAMNDPITLEIFVDPLTNNARGSLYLDDGLSFQYQEESSFILIEFEFNSDGALSMT